MIAAAHKRDLFTIMLMCVAGLFIVKSVRIRIYMTSQTFTHKLDVFAHTHAHDVMRVIIVVKKLTTIHQHWYTR